MFLGNIVASFLITIKHKAQTGPEIFYIKKQIQKFQMDVMPFTCFHFTSAFPYSLGFR